MTATTDDLARLTDAAAVLLEGLERMASAFMALDLALPPVARDENHPDA